MSVIPKDWKLLALEIGELCIAKDFKISGAESCTGGLIVATLTSVAGSSAWVDRGFTTYSNEAKISMLGVCLTTLEAHGAVSEQTANEMAVGTRANSSSSDATIAFSVTGIAGPSGGSVLKPVGTVCFGFATSSGVRASTQHLKGDRDCVREQSVEFVLQELIALLKS